MKDRLYYFDAIRTWLTVLVFYHHASISFGASGGWYYFSPNAMTGLTQGLSSLSMTVDQSFFMSLFFFMSAYLMPHSLKRKGACAFAKSRLLRLGIPLILYTFIGDVVLEYIIYGGSGGPGVGPMWFVAALLVFELFFGLMINPLMERIATKHKPELRTWGIICFMIVSGLVAFLLRLASPVGNDVAGFQLAYFSLYLFMYAAGLAAQHFGWLENISLRRASAWFAIVLLYGIPSVIAMLLTFPNDSDFNGGWNILSFFYATWEPLMCVGISYFALAVGKRWLNRPISWLQHLSHNTFAFYVIHPFVLVFSTFLADYLGIGGIWGVAFVCAVGIPTGFLVVDIFARLKRIFSKKETAPVV